MKPLPKFLLVLWFSLCLVSGAVASQRYALVVGNGDYQFSPLKNPANDAADMAVALQQVGFSVRHLENVSRKELRRAIREFGNDLGEGDVGLFFFAGHGVQSKGENYLIPIGADIEAEYDLEDEAVGVRTVLGAMEESGNGLNIVVLDACRNNPFRSFSRSTNRGLAIVHAPRGTLVAFSTAPGQIAADGTGRNSAYTKHLVAALKTPNLAIEQVFKKVRVAVGRETAGAQVPWEESSLMGDFYFTGESEQTAAIIPTTPKPDTSAEVMFWDTIKDSDDPDMYQAYLQEFPDGKFVSLAKIKLKKLDQAATEEALAKAEAKKTAEEALAKAEAEKAAEQKAAAEALAKAAKAAEEALAKAEAEKAAEQEKVVTTAQAEDSQQTGCPEGTKQTYKGCIEISKAEADAAKAQAIAEAGAEAAALAAVQAAAAVAEAAVAEAAVAEGEVAAAEAAKVAAAEATVKTTNSGGGGDLRSASDRPAGGWFGYQPLTGLGPRGTIARGGGPIGRAGGN